MSDIDSTLKTIVARQTEQMQLMTAMQASIDNLTKINSDLKEDLSALKNGQIRTKFKYINKGEGGVTTETWTTRPGETDDAEIEEIMESRKAAGTWPLKRNFAKSFSKEVDLVKIRFHTSEKHSHKPIRIPKVEKADGTYGGGNKEGRLICRLCSGGKANRNTSWMCSTCQVPLCVDYQGSPDHSCHYRWHSCDDLIKQHEIVNGALKNKRETKKRTGGNVADLHEGMIPKIPKVDAGGLHHAASAVNDPVGNNIHV
eukprot:scaffold39077_cov189-Skeletonema_marinoi.AAC.8